MKLWGAGGGGYYGGAGTLNGSTIAGSGTFLGNTTDPDYVSGVGVGGTTGGGNGLVVISY